MTKPKRIPIEIRQVPSAFTLRQLDVIRELAREIARQEIAKRMINQPVQRRGCG